MSVVCTVLLALHVTRLLFFTRLLLVKMLAIVSSGCMHLKGTGNGKGIFTMVDIVSDMLRACAARCI